MIMNRVRGWTGTVLLGASLQLFAASHAHADSRTEVESLLKAGRHEAALSKAGEHLKKNPNDPQLRFLQGLALTTLGRKDEAVTVFSALTRDYPKLAEPYNNLAVIHAGSGRYEEALAALNKAIQIDPNYATAYENLADLHLQMAQQAVAKVLRLSPDNDAARRRHAQLRTMVDAQGSTAPMAAASSPQPAPAEKPAPGTAAADADAVLAAVRGWAEAWSARDMATYLRSYGPDFRTPKNEARPEWEAKRRALIESKARIAVAVEAPKVSVIAGQATVSFRQNYVSDNFSSNERKTLVLRKYEDGWKIVEERAGG